MTQPLLQGLRAIDLTTPMGAACGRILASFGVEVLHIDAPTTTVDSQQWRACHLGKQAIALDIESSAGRRSLEALITAADFIIESFQPGYLSSLGLSYEHLTQINPRIILVSISTFGQHGPYAQFKGGELIASAMGSVLSTLGDPDRAPVKEALDACSFHGCAAAVTGALMAHYHRRRTGRGQHVDLSLQETAVSRNTNNVLLYQFDKRCVQRGGPALRFGKASIRVVWPLRDGYLFWSMATGRFGAPANRALMLWMNELDYDNPMRDVDWERYDRSVLDADVRKVWEAALMRFFGERTKAEIATEGRRRGINAAVANEVQDLLNDTQLAARDYFASIAWPDASHAVRVPRYFVRGVAPSGRSPGVAALTDNINGLVEQFSGARAAHSLHVADAAIADLPLSGIKVLDFSWALVGALTTKQLGDFGADVVKVESKGRMCLTRMDAQVAVSKPSNPDDKPWFSHLNTSKRGITLDLKNSDTRVVLDRLLDWADIVVENFSPGTMHKLGLDYDSLRKRRPDIIMLSGSVYGQTGPLAQEWGIDGTGAALSSRLFMTGWPDRDPVIPSVPYGDALLPLFMASAAVAALDHRALTGEGTHIDASMFEVQTQQMLPALIGHQLGERMGRAGNRVADAAPHGVFPCVGDDRWIAISVVSDSEWHSLCGAMGRNELAAEPRFATLAGRKANEDALEAVVSAWTSSLEPYALMQQLQLAGVAAGVVQTAADILERDPQLIVRKFLVDAEHPVLGVFGHQAPPYKLSETPGRVRRAPRLGEHTREVCLNDLGIPAKEFERLQAAGVFV